VNAWKKCPLCADPVYKKDIKRVKILSRDENENEIVFQLMVRNKSTTS
jgi:acetyl-CoA carboxylase beta subunit